MKKGQIIIFSLLCFSCLINDLKADPGIDGVNQFRRRNYYVDMYGDTWRMNLSLGGEMYFGEDDLLMISTKRIAPAFTFGVQKDLSGLFGVRLKYTFTGHKNNYLPKDIIPFYSMGVSADLMFNIGKIIAPFADENAPRIYLFAGGGGEYSFEKALHQKYEVKNSLAPTYDMGAYSEIHIYNNIDLTIEIRGNIVPENFDGQVHGISAEGFAVVLIGAVYHFY
ncbi:MAG: hypothetical protein PHV20_05855 [Bacteroidales bacterium]|nr:hypothetical protein [Bacteroidales bacterium]